MYVLVRWCAHVVSGRLDDGVVGVAGGHVCSSFDWVSAMIIVLPDVGLGNSLAFAGMTSGIANSRVWYDSALIVR